MKIDKLNLILLSTIILFATNACKNGNSSESQKNENQVVQTENQFELILEHYLKIQETLVESDVKATRETAKNLNEISGAYPKIEEMTRLIAQTHSLKDQRKVFRDLTELISPMIEKKIQAQTLYKMHCPMAFNGNGGNWYSAKKEVLNPYYGENMLHCGKVVKTLNKE